MSITKPPTSFPALSCFDNPLGNSDYHPVSALKLPSSVPTSTPAVLAAPPGTHLFLARTFRTYYYDSDCNADEIHGLFATSREAEIAMLRAFKKDLVDCCMRIENHLEERGTDGRVAVHAGDAEGDGLIGTVTPIMISPKTLATLAGIADGDDAPGQKRRRKEVVVADEDEDEEMRELEALRAIKSGVENSSDGESDDDGAVEPV